MEKKFQVRFLVGLVLFLCLVGVVPASGGLLAHWQLDEDSGDIASDSVGSNNGTLNGGPVWQPTSGQIAGTLAF